ncbi:uncharacterized protein B0T15DRAFT_250475 [Chaetomium strumarium]|uniref:C2H2-type domain-containing protein n=1 Tax=Chaetomium strumarium TaxID=1170767 RepID=A0AAJ0M0P6_9PEZI|nr:hypothetical protein B0T15DRAFT_250475 [Chaetomium strumarium]
MASCGLEGTPPSESFLSRKKKEIVERSMALFQRSLDRCLDNPVSAPAEDLAQAAGVAARRRAKRARDCDDGDDDAREEGNAAAVRDAATGTGTGTGVAARAKKKRAIREGNGRKFACPFCKHDPVKYRNIKTCCGPGWEDVHRVKEHIYRRHSLKNFCPRCFEHFDKPESLKSHQRADVPCKVRDRCPDAVTEEQEKLLRTRAKSNCTEVSKWEEMYHVIFPGQKVPSPYYDSRTDSCPDGEKSRFKNVDEAREFLRTEIPKYVRPVIEQYATELIQEVQGKVNQKTAEIAREVEARLLRTFHFQEEQSSTLLSSSASLSQGGVAAAEPSPPASPMPELSKVTDMLESMKDDPIASELCNSLRFDVDDLFATAEVIGCDTYSMDSAYYTQSSNGGHGLYGMGGPGYVPHYDGSV